MYILRVRTRGIFKCSTVILKGKLFSVANHAQGYQDCVSECVKRADVPRQIFVEQIGALSES